MPYVLLLAALALAACDAGHDLADLRIDGFSQDPEALVGTWDLISVTTPGQFEAPRTIPAEPGDETLAFRADGTLRIERDGRETDETTWAVVVYPFEYEEGRFRDAAYLQIGEHRKESFGVDGDRLYFDDRPRDGGLHEYARR